MKLSDYVVEFIAGQGVKHIFLLPGGGAMHLNDSIGQSASLEYVATLHEQGASIAAEAYAKATNALGVAQVTSGPGGTNSITGFASAWLDSVPVLVVSGQVKRSDLKRASRVRMLGVQEVDIVSIVRPVAKYAVTVDDPSSIRFHLEKAVHLALSGRRGPVWIDIPLDVQAADVDPERLVGFEVPRSRRGSTLDAQAAEVLRLLGTAKRPVIVAGNGIRAAGAAEGFQRLVDALGVPVLTTWLGMDLLAETDPLFAGRPGSIAPRGANFALQNSDLLISIGARLDMAMTGYAHDKLARGADKVVVDIDDSEIHKLQMDIRLPIVADAADFISELHKGLRSTQLPSYEHWVWQCQEWKRQYPVVQPRHRVQTGVVSTYRLSEAIASCLESGDLVVSGSSGTAIELFLLAFQTKPKQRVLHSRGLGSMGFGLPASIGACIGSGRKRTVCVEGDGSFQMNAQELETIRRLALPIKLFVINNAGYASIRSSQRNYFGRLVAADATSGLTLPDLRRLGEAYGIRTELIADQDSLEQQVKDVIGIDGPVLCEVRSPRDEEREPRLSSVQTNDGNMLSRPLEDLWPFLDRDELQRNMIVPLLEESL